MYMFIKCTCFNSYFKSVVVNEQKQQKISKKQQEQEYK